MNTNTIHEPAAAEKISEERLDRWVTAALEFLEIDPTELAEDAYLRTLIRDTTCHWGTDENEGCDSRFPLCTEDDAYPAGQRHALRERHRDHECWLSQWKRMIECIYYLHDLAGLRCNVKRVNYLLEGYNECRLPKKDGDSFAHVIARVLHHRLRRDQPRTDLVRTLCGDLLEITYTPEYGRDVLLDHLRHADSDSDSDGSHKNPSNRYTRIIDPDLDMEHPGFYVVLSAPEPEPESIPMALHLPLIEPNLYTITVDGFAEDVYDYLDHSHMSPLERSISQRFFVKVTVSVPPVVTKRSCDGTSWQPVYGYPSKTIAFYYFLDTEEDAEDTWIVAHLTEKTSKWSRAIDDFEEAPARSRILYKGSTLDGFSSASPSDLRAMKYPCLDYTRADLRGEWVTRIRGIMRAYEF